MTSATGQGSGTDVHKVQQVIKWIIYALLIINFGYYIAEDWNRAVHTLGPEAGLLDWAGEFATSIDEAGWFILLFMFELETWILEDESWTGWVARLVHGVRFACYLMIAHTVYAYFTGAMALYPATPVDGVSDPCEFAETDVSWVYNLDYTGITDANCGSLSGGDAIYWIEEGAVVSDRAGLDLERSLAWVDVAEAIIWLLILLALEISVRLQNRDITEGALITTARRAQLILFLALVGIAIYWASLSHWLYFWDELVWIAAFAAIDMNLNEWRKEIVAARLPA